MARRAGSSTSTPPPVGGWNTRDALADMPETHAVILDNFFPSTDSVILRRGSVLHCTLPGEFTSEFTTEFTTADKPAVQTLMEYSPPSGNGRLFAAAGSAIYDATSSGTATSAGTGVTDARWVWTQLNTAAGHFMFAANGVDAFRVYDGTDWAAASITGSGLTPADVAWCNIHQNRLWFGEKNSLKAWYMAVETVSGTANGFNLGAVANRGGYLVGMGTWSRDGGDGPDDLAVFVTSEGEAIVYAGTDPAAAATWSLVGVFRIAPPLNRRSLIKAGSDLLILSEDGLLPMSAALSTDRSQSQGIAISRQIDKAFNDAKRDALGSTDEWQLQLYPRGTMLVCNIPQTSPALPVQFVFNTITGAPCRFTGLDAQCWGLFNDELYFGDSAGNVVKFDTGFTDRGDAIVGDGLQAFNYFGSRGQNKSFHRVEPLMQAATDPAPKLDVYADLQITVPTPLDNPLPGSGSVWGAGLWGFAQWNGGFNQIWSGWGVGNIHGRCAAVRLRVNSAYSQPEWLETRWIYGKGGAL